MKLIAIDNIIYKISDLDMKVLNNKLNSDHVGVEQFNIALSRITKKYKPFEYLHANLRTISTDV